MKSLLVTGTDTDVGKTWVSGLILRQLTAAGCRVGAYKPVCSGAETSGNGNTTWFDVESLRTAIGCEDIDKVCPQRFLAAVAPNVAAELEGRRVDGSQLVAGFHAWQSQADLVLVEGAGGLCCPLSNNSTVADLAVELKTPIIIVAANRLGVINHTMLTVEVARSRGISVAAVILNEVKPSNSDDQSRDSNIAQLRKWLPDVAVYRCEHNAVELQTPGTNVVDWFQ